MLPENIGKMVKESEEMPRIFPTHSGDTYNKLYRSTQLQIPLF